MRTNSLDRVLVYSTSPDQLILSVLSYISPDPQPAGHYARLRMLYDFSVDGRYQQQVELLRPLTCWAMRLRLLSWVWERPESPLPWSPGATILASKLSTLANALHADVFLATSVKYFCTFPCPGSGLIHVLRGIMTVHLSWNKSSFPPFVKCLESLPNLHTVEVGWVECSVTTLLKDALKGVKLPQIRSLILPSSAHPLLQHCHDVEDVVYVVRRETTVSDEFLRALASKQGSKVRRLAIPLTLWVNLSRKRSITLHDHRVNTMTDRPRRQYS